MITHLIVQANSDFISGSCKKANNKKEVTIKWDASRLYRTTQAVTCMISLNKLTFSDN
jgi:hypothetical protein